MRIFGFQITRLKKDRLGRPVHPWELVTTDQLSTEARQLISKMARSAARDHFEQMREDLIEIAQRMRDDLTADRTSRPTDEQPAGEKPAPGWEALKCPSCTGDQCNDCRGCTSAAGCSLTKHHLDQCLPF